MALFIVFSVSLRLRGSSEILKLSLSIFPVNPAARGAARHALAVLLFYSLLFTLFFSPILFYDSLLAPGGGNLGDGLLYYLTYFRSEKTFWDTLLATGYPMTADPQVMAWYPPAMLFSLLPGGWNLFVVSAYVMAGCFTYGYAYALTESRLAGLVAGTVYSMSGFMMAHLGHTTIIHVAAWLPLIVWSLEMLRRAPSRGWLAAGSAAVACCVLAGHLQIAVYCLLLCACYALALGWTAPAGRARVYVASLLVFALGLGLAALQLLPAAELGGASTRANYQFSDFVTYSLPVRESVLLLFPAALGGLPRYGATPYFGAWNLTELTGYVGLLAPLLAAVGFVAARRKAVAIFWLCAGTVALLLALGDQTPLASLAYHLPIVGKFRAPARHLLELAFAVSVLAAFGARAILRGAVTRRALLFTIAAGAAMMTAGVLILNSNGLSQSALAQGVAQLDARPWSNPAVGVPLLLFLAAAALLLYWRKAPASLQGRALLLSLLVIDLASFGWFFSWHEFSHPQEILNPPASAAKFRDLLRDSNQRMLSLRGTFGTPDELPPNLSRTWGVANATGYGPLLPSRVINLLSLLPDGSAAASWKNEDDQGLSLAAVRYVSLPRSGAVKDERGISRYEENMGIWLGAGCDQPPRAAVGFELPAPVSATSVHVVSRLACAVGVEDGEEVARVLVMGADGKVQTLSLHAGRDSSEWSYDCPNIKPDVRHGRAEVFSSFPAKMYDAPCEGHFYTAKLPLNEAASVRRLEIQWAGRSGAITVEKISLLDERTGESAAINPLAAQGSPWRFVAEAGQTLIYENPRAMPRAWLVPEVLSLGPEEMLSAIKTSRLPDGRRFDPARTALVEEALFSPTPGPEAAAVARITLLSDTVMEVRTSSPAPSFLVTSDLYYPGWRALLDGQEARLLRADYALRGVQVPAGSHTVRFEFIPRSFYYGAALSALSLLALACLLVLPARSRRLMRPAGSPESSGAD